MDTLGIGIVGTAATSPAPYATDMPDAPALRPRRGTDLDPTRAAAFAAEHGIRAHASFDELLADPDVDIVVNLTVHHAHYEVTKRALEAGKHVYSEKPLALEPPKRASWSRSPDLGGVRLGCSPATFLGEAQQTVGAIIRSGRLGTIRAVYADVNWGRIETLASGARSRSTTSASWSTSASTR